MVRVGEVSTELQDYPILTVGQSRLAESFTAVAFGPGHQPRFALGSLVPVVDPGLRAIADVQIRLDDHVVGYLRPPALGAAIALLEANRAATIEIPVVLMWTPAGPEVRVHRSLT